MVTHGIAATIAHKLEDLNLLRRLRFVSDLKRNKSFRSYEIEKCMNSVI